MPIEYKIIRKHLLETNKFHPALDSLERTITELSKEGWKPHGGLSVYSEYIMQIVVREND